MLDLKFIRENQTLVEKNCKDRGVSADIAQLLELDRQKRELDTKLQDLRAELNKLSATRNDDTIAQARAVKAQVAELEPQVRTLDEKVDALQRVIPNLTHPETPIGDEPDSKEVAHGKTAKLTYSFKPKDHLDVAQDLGIVDMEAGSKVAGPGFYFLKDEAAFLELALQNFAIRKLVSKGFSFQITPDIARNEILSGTGYVPRGNETNTYLLEDTNLSLIATAEIPLCGQYADTVVDVDTPIKLCGLSHCFRTERAGGKATKGLYRVHQFTKVEMVVICHPDHSEGVHQELLAIEREIFDDLGLPYRVLDIASGDLGASAYRKYDLEAWMPGRGENGEYGEVTSASNCTDYQARRLNIKYTDKETKKRNFAHTLNGTAVAISRALVALFETYQQADGSVVFPPELAEKLGIKQITKKTGASKVA